MRKNEGDFGVAWHRPTKTTYGNPDVLLLSVLEHWMSLFLPQEVQTLWAASLLLWLSWEEMQGSWCMEPLKYVHTMPVSEARTENCWGWPQGGADWELLILAPLKRLALTFSLLPSFSPSLHLFLHLHWIFLYSLYTMKMEKPGMKRISLCEDLFAYCSSFHDCLWSDECLCLRGLCLCIRNFRWLWDHGSDSWVLDSKVLGPQAQNHFYKQHLYGNGFLCFQLVQLIWHSIWNYLKSLNFCSFCLYLQGLGSQVCDAVLGLCDTENLT